MKIIFTSDLHSDKDAYEKFTSLLDSSFDIGIISGDLLDDSITKSEMKSTLSLEDDDLLEELYDPDDTIEDLDQRIRDYKDDPESLLSRTLQAKEADYRTILSGTEKPVIIIPGNHDRSKWETGGNIINVNLSRYDFQSFNFVGFKYTSLETPENMEVRYINEIKDLIDGQTIFISHAPAYGILDKNVRGISKGSLNLKKLLETQNFKLHLFGHMHDSFGVEGNHINGAYEKYREFISIEITDSTINISTLSKCSI